MRENNKMNLNLNIQNKKTNKKNYKKYISRGSAEMFKD